MTPLEQVRQALEYLYNYVADNDLTATWAEAERKLQEALVVLSRIEQSTRLIRAQALEEAAKVADNYHKQPYPGPGTDAYWIAVTIRTLKEPEQQVEEMKCSACGETRWLRTSMWHDTPICEPCFMVWYDPDENIDQTDPKAVGALSMKLKAAGKAPWVGKYAEPEEQP